MLKKLNFFLYFYNKEDHTFDFTFTNSTVIIKHSNSNYLINNKESFIIYIVENRIHYVNLNRDYHF